MVKDAHGTSRKFYADSSSDTESLMSEDVYSGNGMPVQGLIMLIDIDDGLMVPVRWKELPDYEEIL